MLLAAADVYGTSVLQIGDSAGLVYPETVQDSIFLKQASVEITTSSRWERLAEGFEPYQIVEMKMHSTYLLQNDGGQTTLPVSAPLPVSVDEDTLSFMLDGSSIEYSNPEYVNPGGTGTGMHLYSLNLPVPPGQSVLEVNATSTGGSGSEIDFTLLLRDASRWPGPVDSLQVSLASQDIILASSSIQPARNTLKAASWEFSTVPDTDLALKMRATMPPVETPPIPSAPVTHPLVPPLIALAVGAVIIGSIAYVRIRRKRAQ